MATGVWAKVAGTWKQIGGSTGGSSDDPASAAEFTVTGVTPNADFTSTGLTGVAGVKYRCWAVNATANVVVTKAGWLRGLLVGAGGGSGGGYGGVLPGGAAPGEILETLMWLPIGTHALTIGAGGLSDAGANMSANQNGANGKATTLHGYKALGGNGGGGGFGAGGQGGNGVSGAQAAGAPGNGGANSGATGGPGAASTITNSSVVYGKGGNYNSGGAATANTGNGANTPSLVGATGKAVLRIAVT